jgi:hypothetical protein
MHWKTWEIWLRTLRVLCMLNVLCGPCWPCVPSCYVGCAMPAMAFSLCDMRAMRAAGTWWQPWQAAATRAR